MSMSNVKKKRLFLVYILCFLLHLLDTKHQFLVKCARNAWHKLGAMDPEEAMQKYITIVSELYPSWADGSTSVSS